MTAAEPGFWAGHPKGSPGYRKIMLALLFAGVATFAQLYSVQGILPAIAQSYGTTPAQAGLSVSAATTGLALAVIPWSWAADRVGRRRAMTAALSAAVVLGLLVPLAPGFKAMLALRFVEGAALGGIPALALAYLSEEVHRLHAAMAAATYVAGTTVGGLAGRIVAGPVADMYGWRGGVMAANVLAAVAAALFIALAPAPRGFNPAARRDGPAPWARVGANLREPRQLALYAQGFFLMGGFVAVYNYLGFRLERPPFSLPVSLASLLFLAYLAGTVSSRVTGGMVGRLGRLPVLLGSIAVVVAGLGVTLLQVLPAVLAGLLVFTAGFFAAHSVASGWTPQAAVVGRAQASSLYNLFYYAGSSIFGWMGGIFFGSFGWSGVAMFAAVLALLAGACAMAALPGAPGGRITG